MEVDNDVLKELIESLWKFENEARSELIGNFHTLSKHHAEITRIRDVLVDLEVALHRDQETLNQNKEKS